MDFGEMAKDEFNSDEEKKILLQLENLEGQAHAGALFEDFKRHPAYAKFEKFMDSFINDSKNTIFNDPDGDHRKVVYQVQGMVRVRNFINAQILAGQIASKAINEHFVAVQEERKQLGIEQ
jgi:lipopolysaccharide biosynthesis regulator YciM